MSSPTNPPFLSDAPPAEEEAQAQIEDYLDYLCAPLLGIVPHAQRRRLRLETEDHLRMLAEDFEAEGFAPDEAVAVALREYGEPWRIGQDFAEAWLSGSAPPHLARYADAATLRAFGWFGVFSVLTLLAVEQYALVPRQENLLPLIEGLAVLSPLLAGVLTGFALHPKTAGGVCRAVLALSAASAAAGLLAWPAREGVGFALFQGLFWLPLGCLFASVTASLRRQWRLQNFRHASRGS